MGVVKFLCIILFFASNNEAARILAYFPTPSISHQVVFRPLLQELAKHGHELIVITTDPAFPKGQTPANYTEIDVHDLSYKAWKEHFLAITSKGSKDSFSQIKVAFHLIARIFKEQMQSDEVQAVLKDTSKKFDLLLVEALAKPALSLTHVLKAPLIQISSLGGTNDNYEVAGAPLHPILYPTFFRQKLYNLTFWEKARELYNHYKYMGWFNRFEAYENELIRKVFGAEVPDLSELGENVDMLFLNVNPIWEDNRPLPPNVITMGGLHQAPMKKLPQELKSYLDNSTNGVIYISFGTNVDPSQMPPEKIQILVKVSSQLPYNVLWKWNKDELEGRSENIKISKWFPQSDLLRHPNVKLFITQGGLQSTDEAITAGVPLIGIPMLGDQWFNVEKYTYHKIGKRLDIDTLTEDEFRDAVHTVIGDKSYRENMIRLRTLMTDQPQTPLERAVWWTEYVIRHGGARHLRSPAANITWAEYLELKFVAALLALAMSFVTVAVLVIYYIAKFLRKYIVDAKMKTS
uniref:UDP-glucuronosyltransferase n=1 Tax=Chilo suppressalis TaxID=168631 RepID=M4M1W9_CHISP|nr:glycosyltransferase 2 [Chilo suppressalis]